MFATIKKIAVDIKNTIVGWAKSLWSIVKQHKSALIGF